MAGRMDGKVSFITGAARGQGRAHAVKQASEGADIIAVDICEDIASNFYPMATFEDLEQTKKLVEAEGRTCVAVKADVRQREELRAQPRKASTPSARSPRCAPTPASCPWPSVVSPTPSTSKTPWTSTSWA